LNRQGRHERQGNSHEKRKKHEHHFSQSCLFVPLRATNGSNFCSVRNFFEQELAEEAELYFAWPQLRHSDSLTPNGAILIQPMPTPYAQQKKNFPANDANQRESRDLFATIRAIRGQKQRRSLLGVVVTGTSHVDEKPGMSRCWPRGV
jgi:hypothetical protein